MHPDGPRAYQLTALSVHLGVMGGGHYVAYARNAAGQWQYFNDSACKVVSEERVAKENGYILVYTAAGLGAFTAG
jgi:ubiquitin C-terminal hydrolase